MRRGPATSSSPLVFSRLSSVIGGSHNPNILLAAPPAAAKRDRGGRPRDCSPDRISAHFRASSTGRMNDLPQVICPSGGLLTGVSSPISKNISLHPSGKSSLQIRAIPPHQRGVSRSSRTRGADAVDAAAFCAQRDCRAGDEPLSDHQASGREMLQRTAKSCGPDAPTLASSSRSCVGPTGLRQDISADDGGKQARSPGRARRKPLKPLRAGMPGDSGGLVVTRVRSTTTIAHETAGASGIRHSPRPPWAGDLSTARAHGAARS
jgi:hypothetical protein